jgi:hypothetical protein
MKQRFDCEVANGVAIFGEKRKYARPEIEVVNLDEQPKLLSASATGSGKAGWGNGLSDGEWEE